MVQYVPLDRIVVKDFLEFGTKEKREPPLYTISSELLPSVCERMVVFSILASGKIGWAGSMGFEARVSDPAVRPDELDYGRADAGVHLATRPSYFMQSNRQAIVGRCLLFRALGNKRRHLSRPRSVPHEVDEEI
jgi:hypothetical protein